MLEQLKKLQNATYSVLLVDRTKEKVAFNYNIASRTALTIDEIANAMKTFRYYNNVKSHDIYLKAETGDFYNVVIDDLTSQKLTAFLKVVCPAYVLFSSNNNYQAVLNLAKKQYTKEQADFITRELNKLFGDQAFAGANHYLRAAGFYNRKKTNNAEKAEFVEFVATSDRASFDYISSLLESYNASKLANYNDIKIVQSNLNQHIDFAELSDQQKRAMRREIVGEIAFCESRFKNLDMSAVDFRIVKRLYKKGYTKSEIASAFELFTDYKNRHADPTDYLKRTINKAIMQI
ncbi:hypothetical protein A1D22_10950 [Pasteurellaceae bacterium LFhippo2]|nr:hypothetical protein [Pasteurellaceae bacterium LFhippo2]